MAVGIDLHLTDNAAIASTAACADSVSVGLTDARPRLVVVLVQPVTDALGLGLTDDSPIVPLLIPVTDSLRAVATEGVPTVNTSLAGTAFLSVTESLACPVSDGTPASWLSTMASDVLAYEIEHVGFGEDVSIFGFTPQQFVNVSVVDTCVVEVETPVTSQAKAASDGLSLGAAESSTASVPFIFATDSLGVTAIEALPSVVPAISASESFAIQAVEPSDLFSAWGATDSLAVPGAEGAPTIAGSFSFNTTDSATLQASEAAPTFLLTQPVAVTDSLAGQASEGGQLIAVAARAAQTLRITVNEAASLLLKFILITDGLGIAVDDAASLFNTFIQLSASDANTIGQSDLVSAINQTLTQLSTTDSLAIGQQDGLLINSAVSAYEALATTLLETLSLSLTYALQDNLAFVAQAEDANIINPFIINVFVFADDTAAITSTDVPTVPTQLLTLVVTDACAVETDDLSLSEDRALPDIWDAHQGVSYDTLMPDPVSYRMDPQKTW